MLSLCPGAASDLETATSIAKAMVTRFGMTDKARPLFILTTSLLNQLFPSLPPSHPHSLTPPGGACSSCG